MSKYSYFYKMVPVFFVFILLLSSQPFEHVSAGVTNQNSGWVEYRDIKYGYGIILPAEWFIYPPPQGENFNTLTITNVDPNVNVNWFSSQLDNSSVKIDLTVIEKIELGLALEDNIRKIYDNEFSSIQEFIQDNDFPQGIFSIIESKQFQQKTKVLNQIYSQNKVISISVLPEGMWKSPEIKEIVNSLVFSREDEIGRPSLVPSPIVNFSNSGNDIASYPCYRGNEVGESPIEMYMPFSAGTTWTVGGSWGYYYGDNPTHTDLYNDYYSTDWTRGKDNNQEALNQPLYPIAEGRVINIGSDPSGYGTYVVILHDLGVTSLYGHMNSETVSVNQLVSIDTNIGTVGTTGNSPYPHLHLSYRVNGISKYDIDPSRRPSPIWVSTDYWDVCDGQWRTATKDGNLFQSIWRNNEGWTRTVPVKNLLQNWENASPWSGPLSINTLPGSGSIQVQNDYAIKRTLFQDIWRSNQGWSRTVPIINGVPKYEQASPWSGPWSLNNLPGGGDIQASSNYAISEKLYQSIWRTSQEWRRTVPIVNGVPNWNSAEPWSGPYPLNRPGSGDLQTTGDYVLGNTKVYQAYWRNNFGYYRWIPINNGAPDFNSNNAWYGPMQLVDLPGTGSIQTECNIPVS